ncbi:hypothetical protein ALT717_70065 [Alteromonas macleodii]
MVIDSNIRYTAIGKPTIQIIELYNFLEKQFDTDISPVN